MKKVSIIIPVYNCEKYIDDCLISVENQTYKDIEVIIVNDGSTDNGINFAKKYLKRNRTWILINQKNQGLSSSRNNGVDISSGDYVFFLDSDDEIPSNAIEKLIESATKNNSDIVIGNMINYNSQGKYPNYTSKYIRNYDNINYLKYPKILSFIHAAGKLYRKDIIKKIRFIPKVKHEDNYFNLSLYLMDLRISMIIDDVYYHRVRENGDRSITQSLNYDTYKDLLINYNYLINQHKFDYIVCKTLCKKIYNYIAKYVDSNMMKLAIKEGKIIIKKIKAKSNICIIHKVILNIYLLIYEIMIYIYKFTKAGGKNG